MVQALVGHADAAGHRYAVADGGYADAYAEARAVLFAAVRAAVLQGLDVELTAYVHLDGVTGKLGACQGGVGSAFDAQVFAGGDAGVVVGGLGAVGASVGLGCADLDGS